jgi:type IV pilus assembly protein PilM
MRGILLSQRKEKTVVGLDIEAGSIAATELRANGTVQVTKYGVAPLPPGVFREGEVVDSEELGAALKRLFSEHKFSRNVRLGLANQRVAVRTLYLPPIDNPAELETAIRFQAQDQIPMPLEQAVLDWSVVGHVGAEAGQRRIQVVVVAARREMVSAALGAMRGAGLRPIGIDVAAFGMIRALHGREHPEVGAAAFVEAAVNGEEQAPTALDPTSPDTLPAKLYCNLGDAMNLAVARGPSCLFTRVSSFGLEGIAQKLAERRELTLEHARQWLVHVGLDAPTAEIEGDPEIVTASRAVLMEGAAKLVDEMRLSLEFYGAQEGSVPVEAVIVCGAGATIPGLVGHLQRDLGYPFMVGLPPDLSHLGEGAAARLTLPYGLALED